MLGAGVGVLADNFRKRTKGRLLAIDLLQTL